jgi:hypothetical protein
MASTLSKPELRSQLNDLRAGSANVRIDANSLDGTAFLPLMKRAMGETGLSQKHMALNAGQPESVISEALNGRRNFAIAWLVLQPGTFIDRFFDLFKEHYGLTPANIKAIQRRRIIELLDLLLEQCA